MVIVNFPDPVHPAPVPVSDQVPVIELLLKVPSMLRVLLVALLGMDWMVS